MDPRNYVQLRFNTHSADLLILFSFSLLTLASCFFAVLIFRSLMILRQRSFIYSRGQAKN